MSRADEIFKKMCRDIIDHGTDTRGQAVRPHWPDGTKAYTIKQFGVTNRYDLREEFPAVTLRRTAIKSATDEILWIWQKKSNNIHDLHSHIWDEWADPDGSIGKAYGYQLRKKYRWKDITEDGLVQVYGEDFKPLEISDPSAAADSDYRAHVWKDAGGGFWMDQVDKVLYDLKVHPFSRRIMTNLYDFSDLNEMNLYPCAYSCTFNVTEENGARVLNMILNQRSQDTLTANNWNVCQYAVLLSMIARDCDMIPGVLLHVIADAHIYDRHVPLIEELIKRPSHPAPKFWLNPEKKDFYSFTRDDVRLDDYVTGEQIKDIPVAI
ncbi:MAG: thymidylate synthase [Lachnospiraceae bacterium]|uniref:Thymidylate synthase n=1 Tax=Candidatus Weimeria bifida TaxID=2599074 RepID=A0A6N7J3L6_9FIRM|nr:thymidylate synthase [Candidatus Weimeria bifida]RRF97309.1 MAG: thymidylate synthase [Lachnospiraceae bacterium]